MRLYCHDCVYYDTDVCQLCITSDVGYVDWEDDCVQDTRANARDTPITDDIPF